MSCDDYRPLLREQTSLLRQINPNAHPQDAECPETADAVHDFLNLDSRNTLQVPVQTASASTN
jgi:hypothetical protein